MWRTDRQTDRQICCRALKIYRYLKGKFFVSVNSMYVKLLRCHKIVWHGAGWIWPQQSTMDKNGQPMDKKKKKRQCCSSCLLGHARKVFCVRFFAQFDVTYCRLTAVKLTSLQSDGHCALGYDYLSASSCCFFRLLRNASLNSHCVETLHMMAQKNSSKRLNHAKVCLPGKIDG